MKSFDKGDRIKWSYTHHLNRKSSTTITKVGVFVRRVNPKNTDGWTLYAMVQFDGNKTLSKVQIKELKYEDE